MIRGSGVLAALVLCAPSLLQAQEPGNEAARAADLRALAREEVKTYTFRPEGPGEAFTLYPEPVLKWSNPIQGSIYGNVYLWTDHGRPAIIGSIHKWYSPFHHTSHEFSSLSLHPVVAARAGETVWNTGQPDVVLTPLPGAPVPAGTPALRLRQMRDLIKDFSGRQTDRENVDRDMRLLTQPVYRYDGTEGALVDGAMFAFVLGTDPEVSVLLEARRVAGALQWQYALARMNSVNLRVSYRGSEVWSVPTIPFRDVYSHRLPYTSFRFDPVEATGKPEGR
jgi:hypothetical protein